MNFEVERISPDSFVIRDKDKDREMTWVGKDYPDADRFINILRWMKMPYVDTWAKECESRRLKL